MIYSKIAIPDKWSRGVMTLVANSTNRYGIGVASRIADTADSPVPLITGKRQNKCLILTYYFHYTNKYGQPDYYRS